MRLIHLSQVTSGSRPDTQRQYSAADGHLPAMHQHGSAHSCLCRLLQVLERRLYRLEPLAGRLPAPAASEASTGSSLRCWLGPATSAAACAAATAAADAAGSSSCSCCSSTASTHCSSAAAKERGKQVSKQAGALIWLGLSRQRSRCDSFHHLAREHVCCCARPLPVDG